MFGGLGSKGVGVLGGGGCGPSEPVVIGGGL